MPVPGRQGQSILLLLLLLAAVPGAAGEDRGAPRSVYCVLRAEAGSDASLRALIASSLRLQLALRQAAMVPADAPDGGSAGRAAALAAARDRGAGWLLEGSYASTKDSLSLRLELFDAAGSSLGSASGQGKINLALDALIVRTLDQALAGLPPAEAPGAGGSASPGTVARPQPLPVETLVPTVEEPKEAGKTKEAGRPKAAGAARTAAVVEAPERAAAVEALPPVLESIPSLAAQGAGSGKPAIGQFPTVFVDAMEIADAGIPAVTDAGISIVPEAGIHEVPDAVVSAVLEASVAGLAASASADPPGAGIRDLALPESAASPAGRPEVSDAGKAQASGAPWPADPDAAGKAMPEVAQAGGGAPSAGATSGGERADAAPRKGAVRPIGISAGAAPFLAVGPVADFTKIGVWSTLALDFRFSAAGAEAETGLLCGFCWFRVGGDVSTADVYLIPIGLDLGLTLSGGEAPAVRFHLSGGPAVMVSSTSYLGILVEAVPYVLGGISVDLLLAPLLSLRIEAEYAAFFEEMTRPIMGFLPGASMVLRF